MTGKPPEPYSGVADVEVQWRVKIPMRDGVYLNATVYTASQRSQSAPSVCALTPYMADHLHDRGVYFASRGMPFVAVDVRGRGDSEGEFKSWIWDAQDGHDVVEWVARQPYCNGRVGMYGGSYLGCVQWLTASESPPHLTTIVPTASPFLGVDVPMRSNIFGLDEVRWQTLVSGRAPHSKAYSDDSFWLAMYRRWFESGLPLRQADASLGNPSPEFQEYLRHPELDAYWDSYNPTADEYAQMQLPVLTITGVYDGDQLGALEHYKQHVRNATPAARARHYLVIGPWNHVGCTIPSAQVDGLIIESAGVIDMFKLHLDWYAWTMRDGPKPQLLQSNVTYYVMVAECWRHSATLEGVTARQEPLYLQSIGNPSDVFGSGYLSRDLPTKRAADPDSYVYDPRDVGCSKLESGLEPKNWITNQQLIHARAGKQLIYHSAPFEEDTEISGFFRLVVWISIDQPDTDFRAWVYEIDANGNSVYLSLDSIRARYRESLREPVLVRTQLPLRYEMDRFTFTSRLIKKGNRLRLAIGPINSIHEEKNYNSGGTVADESMKDARAVTVELFHGADYPSVLYVPVGCVAERGEPKPDSIPAGRVPPTSC